jgi:hypothetical protein
VTSASPAPTAGQIIDSKRAWTANEHRHKVVYRKKVDGTIDLHGRLFRQRLFDQRPLAHDGYTLTLGTTPAIAAVQPANLPGGAVVMGDQYAILFHHVTTTSDALHITDATKSWAVNEHIGTLVFRRFVGDLHTETATIASNTIDTLTLTAPGFVGGVVGATDLYQIADSDATYVARLKGACLK